MSDSIGNKSKKDNDFNTKVLAYSAGAMGFTMISSAFGFYYVKVFLNFYHIEQKWFNIAQVIYLVWNAANDPLFAYLQDKRSLGFTKTRRESVLYAGPLFALAFIVPWFPWGGGAVATGMHLIFALCLWDTMYSFIGLAQCCMFAEMSKKASDRMKLLRGAQIGSLLGSGTIAVLEFTSQSLQNFRIFQFMNIVIAICSWLLFRYMGVHGHTEEDLNQSSNTASKMTDISVELQDSYWKLTWQIVSNKNFLVFVAVNFLHGFHKTSLSKFMTIICEELVPEDEVPPWLRRFFYGSIPICASLFVIFGSTFLKKIGYIKAIRADFIWKFFGGLTMYFIGQNHPYIFMLYILLESCFSSATFSLFNMPLSDIADEDMQRHKRRRPITSMVFGTNALLMKPALSLSPMMMVAILNSYGYQSFLSKAISKDQHEDLKHVMFMLVCFIPVVIGLLQYFIWCMFKASKTVTKCSGDI